MAVGAGDLQGQQLGVFVLQSLLGSGGMAEVYRALDPRLNRLVAVKVLPPILAADPNYVARFRTEARRVAALNHPHIVPVYHYGEEVIKRQRLLYQVMPILRESLRDRLDREGTLPLVAAGRIVVEIASALEAAHEMGLVHRDVKPENILLDHKGKAMLTDFGIAREAMFLRRPGVMQTLAATGLPVGTPEYMAPEQLRNGPVDQRADIYGLGTVLYELLTGVVPHEAETPYEVAALVLTAPLIPPSKHNPNVSRKLEATIMRALARQPEDRFPDARSFAEALAAAIAEPDTVSVPTVGVWPRRTHRFEAVPTAAAPSRRRRGWGGGAGGTPPGIGGGTSPWRGPRRWLLVALAVLLLLMGSFAGIALASRTGFQWPWLAKSQPIVLPTVTATATLQPTETPLPTATLQPSPTPRPTATATPRPTATATPIPVGTGLTGSYFSNRNLTGTPTMTRTDPVISFTNWGPAPPITGVASNYSVRWTGYVVPLYSETYIFTTISDDGVRLLINNQIVVDNWTDHSATSNPGSITLAAGQRYAITLEYYQGGGAAVIQLYWQSERQAQQIVPQIQLFPS
ncbi:MAG TPA: PA14 domain-containing protein [Ktedonobacterales bacterium]|nr:PA14 domain-containing protein [Ktedonobacterales bacterium]